MDNQLFGQKCPPTKRTCAERFRIECIGGHLINFVQSQRWRIVTDVSAAGSFVPSSCLEHFDGISRERFSFIGRFECLSFLPQFLALLYMYVKTMHHLTKQVRERRIGSERYGNTDQQGQSRGNSMETTTKGFFLLARVKVEWNRSSLTVKSSTHVTNTAFRAG